MSGKSGCHGKNNNSSVAVKVLVGIWLPRTASKYFVFAASRPHLSLKFLYCVSAHHIGLVPVAIAL